MRRICFSVLVMAVFAVSSVTAKQKISMEGSTTVLPIAQIAAETFMDKNPDVDISVRGGGSGVGIASLIDNTCDIADASRPMKDNELKEAVGNGIEPTAHVVAMDGIAVILHPSNKIDKLSKKQIKDIYTGKVSNWSDIEGTGMRIVVISRDTASGTYEAFNELALDKQKVRSDALLQASNQAVTNIVARTPGAIGYVGLGYVTTKVKSVLVNEIECNKENVLSGDYPFSRPLFMYTNGKPAGVLKEFLDFIKSKEGQKLAEDAGYVGLK
ncbi:MAG: phosphate ABC transporter substrate-binding protein [Elusimicrobia bacterium]|nr:phosphate ABC transporter substrate-binding protein [Elusimicrobiota bacterium]